ncbi:hypothetical protein [Streptacidiphilus carbonis]|uniref:hypothetical protein n=1 Tax=Streptacidiphilus carbonis TaxID=105422 RepID=UPI0005A965EF|nr:hypothetical protein [Streptacidiphilus carbonis]
MDAETVEAALHSARAGVLRDLTTRDIADAGVVSLLEDAVAQRRWWVEQWPDGAEFLLGLVAQDIQDALLDSYGRWPLCGSCAVEGELQALSVEPELGPDPHWVCEKEGVVVAAVGSLGPA